MCKTHLLPRKVYHIISKLLSPTLFPSSLCPTTCAKFSFSQSISQSVSQSVSQPASQPASHSVSQSVSQSVGQSVSQAVSQAASQPVSPSVSFDEKGCATTYIAHARLPRTHTYIRSPVHTTKCRRREINSFFFKNIYNRTALIHSLARAFVRLLFNNYFESEWGFVCLLYTSPSPRDLSTSRMPSSA